jgi:hypothetical protein
MACFPADPDVLPEFTPDKLYSCIKVSRYGHKIPEFAAQITHASDNGKTHVG